MSDTFQEPDLATKDLDLRRAKEAIAGPVPLIPDQPSAMVDLPRGYRYNGSFQTKAEVAELTGIDEEALARSKEFADFFDTMIAHGTIRLGDFDMTDVSFAERRGALQTLLLGERERLFLAIIQATYGDTRTINFTCGNCQAEQEVDLLLSVDLKVKEVEDIRMSYLYNCRNGDTVEYRLVNGADHLEALRGSTGNQAEQNTTILSRCITRVNDGLLPDPLAYARRMPIRDRRAILKNLVDKQPGVDLEVTTRCVRCQNEQQLPLGWGDLFQT